MGSAQWSATTEEKSDGLVKTFARAAEWALIDDNIKKAGTYPPKYASGIKATAEGQFFARHNYLGDERARIYDCNQSYDGDLMLAENISNNTWVTKSVDLVSKGKVPSTLTQSGSDIFTPARQFLTWQTYADVQQTLGLRNRYVKLSWTDPTLTISTPASTGGKVTFAKASGTTATYNGSQKYTIPYYQKVCSFTLTAVANAGYSFSHWADDTGNKNAVRTLSFTDSDLTSAATTKTYTAVFVKQKYTLTVTAGTGGTVTGAGTYEYGSSVTIKATPNSGYKFVKWSDGNTSATRKVTVTGNATYTAEFAVAAFVTYDSIFCFNKWKANGIAAENGTVSNITNTGFTLTSNAGVAEGTATSHFFPVEAGKSYKIDIDITGDNWDVYIFFCDANGSWVDFADSKNRFSSGGGVASRVFTAPSGSVKAQIRVDANGASNTVAYTNFRIYPADCGYMSSSVSAAERTDTGSWSVPTPSRAGYTFVGWNTKPDGSGTAYTSSSAFPTEDIVLYSIWQALPPKFTSVSMTYGGKQISETNKVPAGEGFLISVGVE